ncbi:MAG: alpha-hydroxy-acid oxidizing protein [Chthoniobacterales bacterium]
MKSVLPISPLGACVGAYLGGRACGGLRSGASRLETREDALLAVEHGTDGIIVSNHGGRRRMPITRPSNACRKLSTPCAGEFR